MFYRVVVQAILLYGSEMWVILAEIERKVEGMHTGLLQHIMFKWVRRLGDGMWETPGTEGVRDAEVTQLETTFI